ncbi:MAG: hypothetical protein D6820_18495, partial [Lentisphaerae bacterium]
PLTAEEKRFLASYLTWQQANKKLKREEKERKLVAWALANGMKFPDRSAYSPNFPAVGIVAAYPSKWTGPYQATIAAYTRSTMKGARFPLRDGGSSHFGTRSYALCLGQRSLFDSTDKLNSLVRRHTDWTLQAQVNDYILTWKRDPAQTGPHILMNRETLQAIRDAIKKGGNNPYARLYRELAAEYLKSGDSTQDSGKKKRKRKISLNEKVLRFLAGDQRNYGIRLPDPFLYLVRRYQDDSVNPTNFGNRRLVNDAFPMADFFSAGKPFGGPKQAAIGYIYTDLDAWPGWHNGWSPGNPNFHTDKYMAAAFAGAAMIDHPHSKRWLAFALSCFNDDLKRVFFPPDGVGYECPGYSGYSLSLQLQLASVFFNCGYGNPVVENPLFKKNLRWHRKLLTPPDPRLGFRHEAPIGDTHRWTSGAENTFMFYARFYRKADPEFASELVGITNYLKKTGFPIKGGFTHNKILDAFLALLPDVPPMAVEKMDWSSQAFQGFGAICRNAFNTPHESFLTFRCGHAMGHYHNDPDAFHFYSGTTPIALDYNCSYHPRGDHAALHNTLTFGKAGKIRHNRRNETVPAHEQAVGDPGKLTVFKSLPQADVMLGLRKLDTLVMQPVFPRDAEFGRHYPVRKVTPFEHRRLV